MQETSKDEILVEEVSEEQQLKTPKIPYQGHLHALVISSLAPTFNFLHSELPRCLHSQDPLQTALPHYPPHCNLLYFLPRYYWWFFCCNDNNRVRFILEDGEALEDVETTENDVVTPKEDVETGNNFAC